MEKKRKHDLQKREKQLTAQIDNLINDSLGLLKCRLNELGIQAKTPPEFIDKAKGIVCQHHDLQRNKANIEAEVRQLEMEQEKMIIDKEKLMIDALLKVNPGMPLGEARKQVKAKIEATINALQGSDNKVTPLLNKLADVTLTKCAAESQLPRETKISKLPKEYPIKRDWPLPEKRSSKATPAGLPPGAKEIVASVSDNWSAMAADGMAKIEEKNPELLAKKIIAEGRSLESKSKSSMSPTKAASSATSGIIVHNRNMMRRPGGLEVEVRRVEQPPPPHPGYYAKHHPGAHGAIPPPPPGLGPAGPPHPHLVPHPAHLPPQPPQAHGGGSRYPDHPDVVHRHGGRPPSSGGVVELPRVDIGAAMSAAGAPPPPHHAHPHQQLLQQQQQQRPPSGHQPPPGPPGGPGGSHELVLPPHPDSKSRSSEHTEDVTYATNKMSSTPRAEQFEDRLKTIIHSVLSGDGEVKPPEGGPAGGGPPGGSSASAGAQNKPMFSPVKKELPAHLPGPPAGVMDPNLPPATAKPRPGVYPGAASGSAASVVSVVPQMSSARTMNEVIEKEIERSLSEGGGHPQQPPAPPPSLPPAGRSAMRSYRMPGHHGIPPDGVSPMSPPQKLVRQNSLPPQASRMSQVIEDSIRGHVAAAAAGGGPVGGRPELEGLACPRTKSPPPPEQQQQRAYGGGRLNGGHPDQQPPQPPPSSSAPTSRSYPAMEGLGARFSSFMEKSRPQDVERASYPPPPPAGSKFPPHRGSPGGGVGVPPPPQDAPISMMQNSRSSYPGGGGGPPPSGYHPAPPTGSSPSYSSMPPRKRASPSSHPILPPKKQHMDPGGGAPADYRYHKGRETTSP